MTTALSPSLKTDPRQTRIRELLEHPRYQESLRAILPRDVTPQRIVRVTLAALQSQPKLLQCSPQSVLLSLMQAAVVGLEPDGGPLGHGYLAPFWNGKAQRLECKFICGYRGLIKMARNSGEIADVWAEVVREGDEFSYELGLAPNMTHRRNDSTADPGALRYAYAVARFRDGERKFVVLNRAEIEAIKAVSPSRDKNGNLTGPWLDFEPEMWKKSAVRRLWKMLPLSADTQRHIAATDETAPAPTSTVADLPFPALDLDEPPALEAPVAEPAQVATLPHDQAVRLAECRTQLD